MQKKSLELVRHVRTLKNKSDEEEEEEEEEAFFPHEYSLGFVKPSKTL